MRIAERTSAGPPFHRAPFGDVLVLGLPIVFENFDVIRGKETNLKRQQQQEREQKVQKANQPIDQWLNYRSKDSIEDMVT